MDIKRLSTDLGVTKMPKARYEELRNLNPLDFPEIKKCLTERERKLGTPEDEIENNVKLNARAMKCRLFTDSRFPRAKWLGTKLRRMAVYQLSLLGYTQSEQAIIFDISPYTIRRDIRSNDTIPNRDWWRESITAKKDSFPITKVWEYTSTPCPHDEIDDESGMNGDKN